jgi:hypothetical protein
MNIKLVTVRTVMYLVKKCIYSVIIAKINTKYMSEHLSPVILYNNDVGLLAAR